MIVKCEQCQTRFKIPDDKVTDKGVKVRCTKCSHTFRVTRDMAQPATGTMPAYNPGAPADPFAKFGAAAEPPFSEVTRPGVFALGVEATRSPELGTAKVPAYPPAVVPPSAPAYPQTQPAGVPAVAHTSSSPFDFSSLKPPPPSAPTVPAVPAFAPASAGAKPFDFAAIAPPTSGGPAPAAFDFSSFAGPQGAPSLPQGMPPPPPPPPSAPSAPTLPNQPLPAFDFGPPGGGAPAAFPAMDLGAPPPGPSSKPMSSAPAVDMSGPIPGAGGGADGFFASTESGMSALPSMDGATARSMFDLPQQPEQSSTLPDIPAPEPEQPTNNNVERVSLARMTPVKDSPTSIAAPEEPPRRRSVVGIVVNIMIAAVLVLGLVVVGSAYLNEGKLSSDSLSVESLKNTFAPSVEFVANDVSNGLYETRAGRSVFFVRGEIMNRSTTTVKVVVKAEIVEDGKVVRSGESWAGDPATPEEIFLIDGAEALDTLNRRVEKRSIAVPPEASAAFVVPFTEYPPDLRGFRVRVSARAVAVNPTTAANP